MKVVCINNKLDSNNPFHITIGKIYETMDGHDYKIIDDSNKVRYYDNRFLISLSEYRKERISKLLEKI